MSEEAPPRLSDEELAAFKASVAERTSQIWSVLGEKIDPTDIVTICAMGLIWVLASKASGKSLEDVLRAAEDAYRNAAIFETELEGEEQDGEA